MLKKRKSPSLESETKPVKPVITETTERQWVRMSRLTLRFPTRRKDWFTYGVGTKGTCPQNGLPIWKILSLDRKLPAIQIPPGVTFYSRGKAGDRLLSKKPAPEMRMYDMYNREFKVPYEPIHDENLKEHFRKKSVQQCLNKINLLSKKKDSICTLAQINAHRNNTRLMNIPFLREVVRKALENEVEAMRIQKLKEKMLKETEQFRQRQRIAQSASSMKAYQLLKARILKEKYDYRKEWKMNSIANIMKKRAEMLKLRREQRLQKEEKQKKNYNRVLKDRMRALKSLKKKQEEKMAKSDRWKEEMRKEREEKYIKRVSEKWNAKCEAFRKKEALNEKLISEYLEKRREKVIARKAAAVRTVIRTAAWPERKRIKLADQRQEKAKYKNERNMINAIVNVWLKDVEDQNEKDEEEYRVRKYMRVADQDDGTSGPSTKGTNHIVLMSGGTYMRMLRVRRLVEADRVLPVPVAYAVDIMLEKTIVEFSKDFMLKIFQTVVEELVKNGKQIYLKMKWDRMKTKRVTLEEELRSARRGAIRYSDVDADEKFRRRVYDSHGLKETIVDKTFAEKVEIPTIEMNMQSCTCIAKVVKKRDDSFTGEIIIFLASRSPEIYQEEQFINVKDPEEDNKSTKIPCKGKDAAKPSYATLAALALEEDNLPDEEETPFNWSEKVNLEGTLIKFGLKFLQICRKHVRECIEPRSRYLAIKKLITLEDPSLNDLNDKFVIEYMYHEGKVIIEETELWNEICMGLTRFAVREILDPPELKRPKNGLLERYKIMFLPPNYKS